MERVKRFTERDVFSNTYTIIYGKVAVVRTKSFEEYLNNAFYGFLTTKGSSIRDFL